MNNNAQGFAITEDPQQANLHTEIENWQAQINFMAKEISFYLKLVALPVLKVEKTGFFLQGLRETNTVNEEFAQTLLQYKNNLDGLNECDDLQCEAYYLDQHEEVRAKIEKHQLRFRAIKSQIFQKQFRK